MTLPTSLSRIRIVLVSPAGPLNIGSIARVMKNFDLSQLVLVAPQCDPLGKEALQMAVHARDVLERAQQVQTIPEALVGCDRAIATTARSRSFSAPLLPPEQLLPPLVHALSQPISHSSSTEQAPSQQAAPAEAALIFGPEDRGLSNSELSYAQQYLKIPSSDTYSALNLAQAVSVCCYELYRASQSNARSFTARSEPSPIEIDRAHQQKSEHQTLSPLRNTPLSDKQSESAEQNKAQIQELEGYFQHLESLLLEVGYLYPHTADSRMLKFRQLMNKATPTSEEVALMRGVLRQVRWALSNTKQG